MIGRKIKVFRLANGGEYIFKDFSEFCKEEGIKRGWIVPYNPQQNVVTEMKNKMIVEVVKAMIHDQDLLMVLWEDIANTIVYVQNEILHRIVEDKTPKEVFIGIKQNIIHLRIFGCPVYVHVPKEKRKKLEPSGNKDTFVGYSETSKAY